MKFVDRFFVGCGDVECDPVLHTRRRRRVFGGSTGFANDGFFFVHDAGHSVSGTGMVAEKGFKCPIRIFAAAENVLFQLFLLLLELKKLGGQLLLDRLGFACVLRRGVYHDEAVRAPFKGFGERLGVVDRPLVVLREATDPLPDPFAPCSFFELGREIVTLRQTGDKPHAMPGHHVEVVRGDQGRIGDADDLLWIEKALLDFGEHLQIPRFVARVVAAHIAHERQALSGDDQPVDKLLQIGSTIIAVSVGNAQEAAIGVRFLVRLV